jgi:hypothetical protein
MRNRRKTDAYFIEREEHRSSFDCEVRWTSAREGSGIPRVLTEFEKLSGLIELEWKGIGTSPN